MTSQFKSEKAAREATIGRAAEMARAAVAGGRPFSDRELNKVKMFSAIFVANGLGEEFPTDPEKLLALANSPLKTQPGLLAELVNEAPKPPRKRA